MTTSRMDAVPTSRMDAVPVGRPTSGPGFPEGGTTVRQAPSGAAEAARNATRGAARGAKPGLDELRKDFAILPDNALQIPEYLARKLNVPMIAMHAAGVGLGALGGAVSGLALPAVRGHYPDAGDPATVQANRAHPKSLDPNHVTTDQDVADLAGNIATLVPLDAPVSAAVKLGGVGARVAARGAVRTARPSSIAQAGDQISARVAKFDAAGVPPTMAAVGPEGSAQVAKAMAENPMVGRRSKANLQASIDATGQQANALASEYGHPASRPATGEAIQTGVQRFANERVEAPNAATSPTRSSSFSTKAGALYDNVFGALETAMQGKTVGTKGIQTANEDTPRAMVGGTAVTAANEDAPRFMQSGQSQIKTPATSAVLGEITGTPAQSSHIADVIRDPTVSRVADAVASGQGNIGFQDLRALRTWVRTAQRNPELRQTIGDANLGRLESALTQDIYTNAETLGSPKLVHQLRRADQYYAAGQTRINDALGSVFKAQSPERAYDAVVTAAQDGGRADINRLLQVKRSLPPDMWGDVAATALNRLGKPTASAPGALDDGAFSVSTFVTNYSKLSPEGRDVLFGARGGGGARASSLRAQLDNLAEVADMQKGVERAANTSNTAVAGQAAGTVAGLVTHTIPTLGVLAGVRGVGEAMTNPAFVRWVVRMHKARSAKAQAAMLDGLDRLAKDAPEIAAVSGSIRDKVSAAVRAEQVRESVVRQVGADKALQEP